MLSKHDHNMTYSEAYKFRLQGRSLLTCEMQLTISTSQVHFAAIGFESNATKSSEMFHTGRTANGRAKDFG